MRIAVTLAGGLLAAALATGPAGAAQAGCELHVWPSTQQSAASAGSWMGGVVPALVAGDNVTPGDLAARILNGDDQIDQLKRVDLVKSLSLPADTAIFYHNSEPFNGSRNARNAASSSPCYYELKVDSIIYARHPLYGKQLIPAFTFRNFGNDAKVDKTWSSRVRVKMKGFPDSTLPRDDKEYAVMAEAMNSAFASGFATFAARVKP